MVWLWKSNNPRRRGEEEDDEEDEEESGSNASSTGSEILHLRDSIVQSSRNGHDQANRLPDWSFFDERVLTDVLTNNNNGSGEKKGKKKGKKKAAGI